jgi:hypothetical protein
MMGRNESNTLTQADLVAELGRTGRGVKERSIANWRDLELLPDFDKAGPGRGKGPGRGRSVWTRGTEALSQATWIYDMLRRYKRFDALYLPLWIIGCHIPLGRVRQALAEPLEGIADSIARSRVVGEVEIGVEDVIDDAVQEYIQDSQRAGVKRSQTEEAVEVSMNLVFNSDYNLADPLIKESIGKLWTWKGALKCARFVSRHLSLRGFKEALDEATDDDLIAVRRDLGLLKEMVCLFGQMVSRLPADVRERLNKCFAGKLPALFSMGEICVFVDLSLRRNGYGEWIDRMLQMALTHLRGEFGELLERELSSAFARMNVRQSGSGAVSA